MTIGDRIKEVRIKSGLTQEALASKMGIAKTTLTGYEKGNRGPKSDMLMKIAIICGTSVDYLVGVEEVEKEDEISEFARKFDALDAHGRLLVKTVLDLEYERCTGPAEDSL